MNLGNCLLRRFERLGNITDLNMAIDNQQRAISLLPPEHHDKPGSLVNLATSYLRLFESQRDPENLERSIKALEDGLSLSPDEIIVLPSLLTTLGIGLMRRSELKYSIADIDRAIEVQRKAVALTPDGHEDLPRWLNNLGNSFSTRYEHHKDVHDLEGSIEVQRRALMLTPPEYKNFYKQSSNLGLALMLRYLRHGSIEDIEESIALQRQAITAEDGIADKWQWMQNLASAFYARFQSLGILADLEESILIQQKAIPLAGGNSPGLPGAYSQLGMLLFYRFKRTKNIDDIDAAIQAIREAINLSPEGQPDILEYRNHLSVCLTARFERADDPGDIKEAIATQRMVLQNTPETSPNYTQFLVNFTICLLSKFERDDNMNDLTEAILFAEVSLKLTDEGNPLLPGRLANVGRSLLYHFQKSHENKMLDRAILAYRKAIELTPDNHVGLVQYLGELGDTYIEKYESTNNVADLNDAIVAYHGSATQSTGSPIVRLNSGRTWALVCKAQGSYTEAFTAYSVCFEILPQVVSLGQTINNRHTHLKSLSTLATEAAAVAIELGKISTAVEWLEQGRSIVWNQLNSLRSPFHELREAYPSLADKLALASDRLQHAGSRAQVQLSIKDISRGISLQDEVIQHQNLAQDWESLVNTVRQLPAFEKFLLPLNFQEIMTSLPKDGYVVVINLDVLRCDALVLQHRASQPIHIPLERFDVDISENLRKELDIILKLHNLLVRDVRAGRLAVTKSNSHGFEAVLKQLWQFVASPVLDRLNIKTRSDTPPRLWWCTTGALSFLPIHAAGIYMSAAMKAPIRVPDLVISSYTPTLSALFEKKGHSKEQDFQGFLAICQPNTPDLPAIPKTEVEAELAMSLFNTEKLKTLQLTGAAATRDKVLQEMGNYSWIHFACHALQDEDDPTKSAIYLHDAQLAISDIIQKSLPHADFAFLSACQTATGDRKLSEEAVHLAAGMLTAGYRGIIASMWSISDEYAPKVAKEVYQHVLRSRVNGESPDSSLSANALQSAIDKVRQELSLNNTEDTSFLTWVPFIHIGK
ncbi:CHAT domain-containing protein [Cyathus striatus]|nr:CHAT domain-containing protein [Cyathus striatus]